MSKTAIPLSVQASAVEAVAKLGAAGLIRAGIRRAEADYIAPQIEAAAKTLRLFAAAEDDIRDVLRRRAERV